MPPTRESSGERTPSDVSGEHSSAALAAVVASFEELLLLPDPGAVYVALAGVVANYGTGDPVWPLLVGPPGCGKSEIISSLASAPGVWPLSSLTPQTLLSGFEARNGKQPSLLLQIGAFGILAFKDLTTVLTMHREARAAIIGQLREVADGRSEKSFGNGVRVAWEGKLGLLAGVTPVIDEQHAFLATMGERFVLYRMPSGSRRELARRALARRGQEPELRARLRSAVAAFLPGFANRGRLALPPSFAEPLASLADLVTRARSGVARDGYTRELLYLPEAEAPTRLAKQLGQLSAALLALGLPPAATWRLVRKIGWDCVPAVRCSLLAEIDGRREPVTPAGLAEALGLPPKTTERAVEDLAVLGLLRRFKEGGRWQLRASELMQAYWAEECSPETSEGEGGRHGAALACEPKRAGA